MSILKNKEIIENNIKSDSKIIVYVENQSLRTLNQLIYIGFNDFAKSTLKNIKIKEKIKKKINWHYIGETNFFNSFLVVKHFTYLHLKDSFTGLSTINFWAKINGKKMLVLLPLKILIDSDKKKLKTMIKKIQKLKNIFILGFSGQVKGSYFEKIDAFKKVKKESENLKKELTQLKNSNHSKLKNINIKYLVMGNSKDYKIAIKKGSNAIILEEQLFKEPSLIFD